MLFGSNNEICTNPKQIADTLREQLRSVFSNPENASPEVVVFGEPSIRREFQDSDLLFTKEEIEQAIDTIKLDAA